MTHLSSLLAARPMRGRRAVRGLAGRLMTVIFGGYLVVALLLTGVQMMLEYRSAVQKLERDVQALGKTFGPGIADAMWRYNTDVLEGILMGMKEMPIVRGVEVSDEKGKRVAAAGEIDEDRPAPKEASPRETGWDRWFPSLGHLRHRFDLVYRGERGTSLAIGSWTVLANDDAVQTQLMRTLSIVLVNSAIKTVLLWAIFSFVIRRMVGRPLAALGGYVREIDVNNLRPRPPLDLGNQPELHALAGTIDTMADRLSRAFEENAALLDATRELNATLQARVEERTRELEVLARTDLLTGLANRRRLDEVLSGAVERALREGAPLSIVLADIDHFKLVNDRYGHKAGDEVLAGFARTLSAMLRPGDTLGRWGGEEFVLVCPDTGAEAAAALAEALRRRVEETRLPIVGGRTCSFGVAALRPGEGESELVIRADAALYAAKNAGRNRVVASSRAA